MLKEPLKRVARKVLRLVAAPPAARFPPCVNLYLAPDVKLVADQIVAPHGDCTLSMGAGTVFHASVAFERAGATVRVGERTFVGGGTRLVCSTSIEIGDDVLMSWGITVVDHNSHSLRFSERAKDVTEWKAGRKDWTHVACAPVVIGRRAWVGFEAAILKGVTVGEGAVIGARTVVTKDVPPYSVVAGNPARVVRELGPDER